MYRIIEKDGERQTIAERTKEIDVDGVPTEIDATMDGYEDWAVIGTTDREPEPGEVWDEVGLAWVIDQIALDDHTAKQAENLEEEQWDRMARRKRMYEMRRRILKDMVDMDFEVGAIGPGQRDAKYAWIQAKYPPL